MEPPATGWSRGGRAEWRTMLDPINLSAGASAVDAAFREPPDDAFVADDADDDDADDTDDTDDTDDDADDDDADDTDDISRDDQETTPTVSDDHEVTPIISKQAALEAREQRLALEARILDSGTPVAELIEQEVARLAEQVERDVVSIAPDAVTIDGFSARETLRGQVHTLRLRLEHAVVCPWPVRPAHRESKLPAWQRLRVLEVVAGLRSWQVKRLRGLSMQIGDLDFWLDLPRCATGETKCGCWRCLGEPMDARWPVTLKAALWKRWREARSAGVGLISGGRSGHASAQRSGDCQQI